MANTSSPSHPPVRVGVIGLGFMGLTHLVAYQAAAEAGFPCRLTAVADPKEHRRRGDLADVGGNIKTTGRPKDALFDPNDVRGHANPDDLLTDPNVDLVSICTRTDTHVDLAINALAAGKHVLVEKPVALTVADARRLADAAAKSDRVCVPAMCMRYWPAWQWLKQRIDDGSLGPLRTATFTRLAYAHPGGASTSWKGGALFDLHIHDADFVRWCFGRPAAVSSTGYANPHGDVDHVVTHYHYPGPNAPCVTAEGGAAQHPGFAFRMRYVANFDRATADFDMGRTPQLLLCHGGTSEPVEVPPHLGYDGEVRAVLTAITTADRTGLPTAADAVETTRLLEAEHQSILTGKSVML